VGRQVTLTIKSVPVREDAATILEFDDTGLIRQFRSYHIGRLPRTCRRCG
jgi:hypothetical protein